MIILDANIIIRAVLGQRVRDLLIRYSGVVRFLAPVYAIEEVDANLPVILLRRSILYNDAIDLVAVRNQLDLMIEPIPEEAFLSFKDAALDRLARRDPDDWPNLASALALNCPVWTEDTDFFGTGIATWTTDRIEIYLQSRAAMK
jgi:predicted nucleic acid-binding protein